MGNTASACAATPANAVIAKILREQSETQIVQQAFTEFDHDNDQQTDPAAPRAGTSSFESAKSKDVFQNLRARTHPVPTELDLFGSPASFHAEATSTSPGEDLHAFTQNLKKITEYIKDSVYELIREDYPDVEFVFFHGLQPNPEDTVHAFWRTWKMRFTEQCWLTSLLPKLLNYTEREIKPRVLSVSYGNSSKLGLRSWMASPIDQFSTSENLMMDLILTGRRAVGQKHNVPVILVGHDLGGIMIKHLLMKVKKTLAAECLAAGMKRNLKFFWDSLSALVFYAAPQVGYPTIDDKIPPNSSRPSLQFLRALNKDTARVNKEFENFRIFKDPKYEIPTLRIWESAKTDQGRYHNELVAPGHMRGTNDNDYTALWEDHFQVCQPSGVHSCTARRFASFVVQLINVLREDEHFM